MEKGEDNGKPQQKGKTTHGSYSYNYSWCVHITIHSIHAYRAQLFRQALHFHHAQQQLLLLHWRQLRPFVLAGDLGQNPTRPKGLLELGLHFVVFGQWRPVFFEPFFRECNRVLRYMYIYT